MNKQRLDRVNSLLREVLSEVIQREVRHPVIKTCVVVTRVDTSPDLRHARVYVSLIASPEEKEKVCVALRSAAGFIAIQASHRVNLRYFPRLIFALDTTVDEQMHIDRILRQIEQERDCKDT